MVKMIVRTPVDVLLCITIFAQLVTHDCQAACVGANACTCEAKTSGAIIINCRDQNLDRVPTFQNVEPDRLFEELTLERNQIGQIDAKAFATLRLKRLLLSENPIANVSNQAFQGLEADLKELSMQLAPEADFPVSGIQLLKQLGKLEVIGYQQPRLPTGALASLADIEAIGLTVGGLQELSEADFTDQRQLLYLDLSENRFTEIPVAAINTLKQLSELKLTLNGITAVGENSFSSLSQLKVLDLSRNSLTSVHPNAFSGLERSLQNLTMQYCSLTSESMQSVKLLRTLIVLDISDNQITSIDSLLGNMRSLQELKIARNRITVVTRSLYRSMSSSLRLLDLSFNSITEVTPDAFLDLHQLQDLYLDGASGLQLDGTSFSAQQTSLKLLSMRYANLSVSQWTSINNLTSLQTLWMSNCELNSIPDFTFRLINQLESLDLNDNLISRVTQRSLAGLHNSLVRLYLTKNQLTTLDECVFHQFTKIDILRLQLSMNPLECNCSMKWLHDRLQLLRKNSSSLALINALRWTCANLNSRLFNSLTDADFANCTSAPMVCEDLGGQTTTAPIGTISLDVVNISSSSMTVLWTIVLENRAVTIWRLQYRVKDSDSESVLSLEPELRNATLTGLSPATTYVIVLQADTADGTISASTSASTTNEQMESSNLPVILGCTLGLGLALVLLVIVIVMVLASRKKRRKDSTVVIKPKLGDQSKRFIKPDVSRANSMGRPDAHSPTLLPAAAAEMASDDLIVQTLETMSDEEKYRLVNLLTNSRGSVDGLNDLGLPGHVQPYGVSEPPKERHVYEEIPDSYYDEIETDDTV